MVELELRLARIALSVICSISPVPKVGVGIAEDDVVVADLSLEILLLDIAARGVRVPGDHEEGMDTAVAGTVGIELEASLADGAVRRNEGRNPVPCPEAEGAHHGEQGILRRARAADVRLGMAAPASVEVETRAEAITDFFRLVEVVPPYREHFLLVRVQAGEHATCSRCSPRTPGSRGPRNCAGRF